MTKLIYASLIVVLIGVSTSVRAMPIEYTLNTFTGNAGSTLNGSITVDDDGDGIVIGSEITAWGFSSDLDGGISFGSLDVGASVTCSGVFECFSVVSTSLVFDFGPLPIASHVVFQINVGTYHQVLFDASSPDFSFPNEVNWVRDDPLVFDLLSPGLGRMEVAVAASGTVPVPPSLALLAIALAGWFGVAGARSGKRQPSLV